MTSKKGFKNFTTRVKKDQLKQAIL